MNQPEGRHEIKSFISHADFIELRQRLPHIATPDEHAAKSDGYRVRSLYFDNYRDKALLEKIDGVNEREKFRLRLYNDDPSFIRLEKKSKNNGLCTKHGATISQEDCRMLLRGDYDVLKQTGDPLCLELYAKIRYQLLRPKTIVDYMRAAYVYPAGNVRITLDYAIRASSDILSFPEAAIITQPVSGPVVLEIKYDAYLPEVIRGMVALSGRQRTAFSKYAACRTM